MKAYMDDPSVQEDAIQLRIQLHLSVTDPDIVAALSNIAEVRDRDDYAIAAMKVGVLAIRQASGVLDSRTIHDECHELLRSVGEALSAHSESVSSQVTGLLSRYFDPTAGEFPQRIERLIRRDGELETLLSKHLSGDESWLARTMERHVGANSPLLQMLSPDQRKGILAAMTDTLQAIMSEHSKRICREFSLDDKDSALSRLIDEMSDKNGSLRRELAEDVEHIRQEFSLDNDEGALARLVKKVERAHETILDEFSSDNEQSALSRMATLLERTNQNIASSLSLDEDQSPLSRLRREMLNVFDNLERSNRDFQEDMRTTIESLRVRRDEAARSTSHGLDFEESVGAFIQREAQRLGDIFEDAKSTTGAISRCKVGDFVVTLSPEAAAAGSRIVFEAKADKSYSMKHALNELRLARENRQADIGVFVFDSTTAPEGIEPLSRFGQDLVVVWDATDAATDVYLKAVVSMARLIVVQQARDAAQTSACIEEMETALSTLIRDIGMLDEITKMAQTVRSSGEKIVDRSESLKKKVEKQLETLRSHMTSLREQEASA